MMRVTAVVVLFHDLRESELRSWVDRGWVRPEGTEPDFVFQAVDVARVRLIHDFRRTMSVADDTCRWFCRYSTRSTHYAARSRLSRGQSRANLSRCEWRFWRRSGGRKQNPHLAVRACPAIDLGMPSPLEGSICLRKATASRFATRSSVVSLRGRSKGEKWRSYMALISAQRRLDGRRIRAAAPQLQVLRLGARIFPEAREPDGKPLNQNRRQKRMARRQLRRRRDRRRALNESLAAAGLLPSFGTADWDTVMNREPTILRKKGLTEALEIL